MTTIMGIIVSVDFADYLQITLPLNQAQLSEVYVITAEDDEATRSVCERHSARCLPMPRTTPFLKGLYINHAFDEVPKKDWILILDADTVLPSNFQQSLNDLTLDPNRLWGVSQRYCYNHEQWIEFATNGRAYEWPRRWTVCMGCFQLFHTSQFENTPDLAYEPFTVDKQSGKGSDWLFSRRFRRRRGRIPDLDVIHLATGPHDHNWNGRVTPSFAPGKAT